MMHETTTLHSWDGKSILRLLNSATEKLTVLDAAGVNVPKFEVSEARDLLLKVLIHDVRAETIEPAPVAALAAAAE